MARNFAQVAQVFGVSETTVRKEWVARGMPGEKGCYPILPIIQWRHDRDVADKRRPVAVGLEDDPMLAGPVSPALERFREARASIAELDFLKRTGEVIDREQIHEVFSRIAMVLRGAGEKLERDFGGDARGIFDAALDEAERVADGVFAAAEDVDEASENRDSLPVEDGAIESSAGHPAVC